MDEQQARKIREHIRKLAIQTDNPIASTYFLRFMAAELKGEPIQPIAEELQTVVGAAGEIGRVMDKALREQGSSLEQLRATREDVRIRNPAKSGRRSNAG